ncbi:transcriptional antiterminator, Rof [Arcobacter nitrofigilis DSM 7299]|uniref:Transcriptional antiterminator, Rof n=1 Tax=Arcobacter nitrofigilis (strain ATCC 33309 / DSM 7299 / CCUG 15893 / LMG 7604 / NCTC 12251 / CI) TaxID=572480 RepID=D5V6M0_ARCNC|nr:transcriptional antiterminator Rof [Arcobacter nitrofigilis]ADG94290.1 transcriptional antiterminator, Rof [Arcobacter nitrofigilis DSM 7299]
MYNPISCEFFDQLDIAIKRKIPSTIIYFNNEDISTIKGLVNKLTVVKGKEYLVLNNKQEIRLDLIISFNGKIYIEI